MDYLTRVFAERGDLAHLALFLWAASASGLLIFTLRELASAMRRFDEFVRELARFNDELGDANDGHTTRRASLDPQRDAAAPRPPRGVS